MSKSTLKNTLLFMNDYLTLLKKRKVLFVLQETLLINF